MPLDGDAGFVHRRPIATQVLPLARTHRPPSLPSRVQLQPPSPLQHQPLGLRHRSPSRSSNLTNHSGRRANPPDRVSSIEQAGHFARSPDHAVKRAPRSARVCSSDELRRVSAAVGVVVGRGGGGL